MKKDNNIILPDEVITSKIHLIRGSHGIAKCDTFQTTSRWLISISFTEHGVFVISQRLWLIMLISAVNNVCGLMLPDLLIVASAKQKTNYKY